MIEFSRWIRKTHPNYFTESEDLTANPQSPNPQDEGGAVNVDKLTVAPTPDDFKNEVIQSVNEMAKAHADCCKNWGTSLKQTWENAENPRLDPKSEIKINKKGHAFLMMNAMIGLCNEQHKRLLDFLNSNGFELVYYFYKIHEMQKATVNLAKSRNNASSLTKYLLPVHKIVSNFLEYGSSPDKKFFSFMKEQLQRNFREKLANFHFPLHRCYTTLSSNIDVKNPNFNFSKPMDEIYEEFQGIQGTIPDIGELGSALSEMQNEASKIESLLNDAIAKGVSIPKNILAFNK